MFTIFSDGLEHTLEDVIVDNNMKKTNAVEVAVEYQGENGAQKKNLTHKYNMSSHYIYSVLVQTTFSSYYAPLPPSSPHTPPTHTHTHTLLPFSPPPNFHTTYSSLPSPPPPPPPPPPFLMPHSPQHRWSVVQIQKCLSLFLQEPFSLYTCVWK